MYEPNTCSSFFSILENLLNDNFSPILAVLLTIKSLTVSPSTTKFKTSSLVFGSFSIIAFKIAFTKSLNSWFLATKSVSELTSTITALLPSIKISAKPSAAILSA